MRQNLIILAAGASSRMKNSIDDSLDKQLAAQANTRTKGLIPIAKGRPLLDFLMYNAKKSGYTNIYLVISEKDKMICNRYGGCFEGLSMTYAIQYVPRGREKPLGTADAVAQTLQQYPNLQGEYFTVCNSDNLYSKEVFKKLLHTKALNAFIAYDRDALNFHFKRIQQFALVSLDEENYLQDIIEKPSETKSKKYVDSFGKLRVSMNIFLFYGPLFSPYVINCPITKSRNERELPTALLNMLNDHPKSVVGIPVSEHVPDITSKKDIALMREYIEENTGDFNLE